MVKRNCYEEQVMMSALKVRDGAKKRQPDECVLVMPLLLSVMSLKKRVQKGKKQGA